MNDKHSEQWELLKKQGKKHRREKAIMVFVIIVLVVVNFVLANIVWQARRNNETASAAAPVNQAAAVTVTPVTAILNRLNRRNVKKDWVIGEWETYHG